MEYPLSLSVFALFTFNDCDFLNIFSSTKIMAQLYFFSETIFFSSSLEAEKNKYQMLKSLRVTRVSSLIVE